MGVAEIGSLTSVPFSRRIRFTVAHGVASITTSIGWGGGGAVGSTMGLAEGMGPRRRRPPRPPNGDGGCAGQDHRALARGHPPPEARALRGRPSVARWRSRIGPEHRPIRWARRARDHRAVGVDDRAGVPVDPPNRLFLQLDRLLRMGVDFERLASMPQRFLDLTVIERGSSRLDELVEPLYPPPLDVMVRAGNTHRLVQLAGVGVVRCQAPGAIEQLDGLRDRAALQFLMTLYEQRARFDSRQLEAGPPEQIERFRLRVVELEDQLALSSCRRKLPRFEQLARGVQRRLNPRGPLLDQCVALFAFARHRGNRGGFAFLRDRLGQWP